MTANEPMMTEESFRQLLLTAGYAVLQRIARDLAGDDLTPVQVAKYGKCYAAIYRQKVAREKCRAALEIARINADARCKQAEAAQRSHMNCDTYDPAFPWGRNPDGSARTHEEFMKVITPKVRAAFGDNYNPGPPNPWSADA
jgi:hypothetical protein